MTVTSRRILRAAVFLLFVLISTAAIYFLLDFEFLAAVQITVYAGGIVVLIVFSILLTSHIEDKLERPGWKKSTASAVAVLAGTVICISTILNFGFQQTTYATIDSNMTAIGTHLLGYGKYGYVLPFEVISVLLLAAMLGAIVIAKREKRSA